MKKYWLSALGAIALAACGYFVANSLGQFGQREIELLPATSLVAPGTNPASTITSGLLAPRPRGANVRVNKRLMGVVQVNTAPTIGGDSGTALDVYFQSSPDCGMCWQDFAHVSLTTAGTYYVPLSLGPDAAWPTTVPAMQ